MRASLVARLAFAVIAVSAVVLPSTAAAAKSGVPFTDGRSTGSLAFCNSAGQNITHGSVYDKPFAYRVVSSVPAPTPYRVAGRLASLYAFQPRKGVDPAEWNGDNLTAPSAYTNALVPMAQGSKRDIALSDFLDEYPAAWDNLVQLRLFASAPNVSVDSFSYPSATIQIKGTTWTLLDPIPVSCTTGRATTPEDLIPSANPIGLGSPEPLYNLTPGVVVIGTPSARVVANAHSSGGSNSKLRIAAGSVAGVIVLGGGSAMWWRRRSRASG